MRSVAPGASLEWGLKPHTNAGRHRCLPADTPVGLLLSGNQADDRSYLSVGVADCGWPSVRAEHIARPCYLYSVQSFPMPSSTALLPPKLGTCAWFRMELKAPLPCNDTSTSRRLKSQSNACPLGRGLKQAGCHWGCRDNLMCSMGYPLPPSWSVMHIHTL